jgi:Protein tyrosine and serine/threonine kinase/SH2 domain
MLRKVLHGFTTISHLYFIEILRYVFRRRKKKIENRKTKIEKKKKNERKKKEEKEKANVSFVYKTANLLYDETKKIKVCDFGLSETKPKGRELYDRQPKGTPLYMAPEVMRQEQITEKVDVYSFGIILWEMYTRKEAFTEFEDYDTFYRSVVEQNYRPHNPTSMPQRLRELIEMCWAADPNTRPRFSKIVTELELIRCDAVKRGAEEQVERHIKDELGQEMWKQHSLGKRSVPWIQFVTQFYALLGLELPEQPALPEDASADQLREASERQLDDFAQLSDDAALLVAEERQRRGREASSSSSPRANVPDGYENEGQLVDGGRASSSGGGASSSTASSLVTGAAAELSLNRSGDAVGASAYMSTTEQRDDVIINDDTCKFYCLKALVADEDDQVAIDVLGRVLACFGPVETPHVEGGVLDRMQDLMREPYFHGFLSAKSVENLLRVLCRGTYLVRFSNTYPASLCISKVSTKRCIRHIVVPKTSRGWRVDGRFYPTMQQLIEAVAAKYYLQFPCPGSRFAWLFEEESAALGGYGDISAQEIEDALSFAALHPNPAP